MSEIDNRRGFAGFEDLVSDVSKDLEQVENPTLSKNKSEASPITATSSARKPETPSQPTRDSQQPVEKSSTKTNSKQSGLGSGGLDPLYNPSSLIKLLNPSSLFKILDPSFIKWTIVVFLGILFVGWLANSSDNSNRAYTTDPISESTTVSEQGSNPEPESAIEQQPAVSTGEKPPVGRNNTLTHDQIKYCLCEKIRINEMNKIINDTSEAEINLFNEAVDDYNSRCSAFRYRAGTLESIRSEVEEMRSSLEEEGRHRIMVLR